MELENFFNPHSIAIVGASEDPTSLGTVLYDNLRSSGFSNPIYFINPKYDTLWDQTCYKSLKDVPGEVDMALIAIPAKFVIEVIRDATEKHVKSAIIISAGFREVGDGGKKLEDEIIAVAKNGNVRLLGPNCLGMIVPKFKLNASFAASTPSDGNIAFLSQSGAFCTAMIDWALDHNLGFSHFVSLGNKADISEIDLIKSWNADESVKVIAAYLEEIEDGRELVLTIEKSTKPVVILKPGKSEEAQQAMSSHTGSLATSSVLVETALKQANAIQVFGMQEMFNMMMALSWSIPPQGKRIAVVTNAGGPGIIATDTLKDEGLELAQFSAETTTYLKENLPSTANIHNPVDVIGDALAERFKLPLDALAKDENVDGIVIIVTPQLVTQIEETAKLIVAEAKRLGKPIFTAFVGGKYSLSGKQRLVENKVPSFDYVESAIRTMAQLYQYEQRKKINRNVSLPEPIRNEKSIAIITKNIAEKDHALSSAESNSLLEEFGIDIPHQSVVNSITESIQFAQKVGYPVVIKSASDLILHKTDFKALYLNITNDQQLQRNYAELEGTMRHVIGNEVPLPILIQEQIADGVEIILGAKRDGNKNVYSNDAGIPGFGHLLLFGSGGIYTEVYKDTSSRIVPVTQDDIRNMIAETRINTILNGTRGQEPLATQRIVETIEKISHMVVSYPEIDQIDVNPAFVTKTRCIVVDFKVLVKE